MHAAGRRTALAHLDHGPPLVAEQLRGLSGFFGASAWGQSKMVFPREDGLPKRVWGKIAEFIAASELAAELRLHSRSGRAEVFACGVPGPVDHIVGGMGGGKLQPPFVVEGFTLEGCPLGQPHRWQLGIASVRVAVVSKRLRLASHTG